MPIRVAILGTGWGSRVQVPVFRRAGFEIASLWSPTPANAEAAAREWGVPRVERDPLAAIARNDVELVSVVTPPHTHAELAVAALDAGKHLLCEKPTALDADEAERMAAAAARRPHLIALVDHELRFHPHRRRLRELLAEGTIGRPLAADASFLGGGRLGDRWPWSWWSRADRGGGILGAAGSHLIDQLHWLLGRRTRRIWARLETALPERRDASGRPQVVSADELATLALELDGGLTATLRLSAVTAGPRCNSLRIDGERGSLWLDGDRLRHYHADGRSDEIEVPAGVDLAPLRRDEWTVGSYHLARALRAALDSGNRSPLAEAADLAAGLAVQRVLDAARASDRDGGWVEPAW